MIVSEFMTVAIAGVTPKEMFSSVISLLREQNCSCIPVSDKGRPKGIITERDVVRYLADNLLRQATTNPYFDDVPVSDVMTPEPVCVQETTSLYDALMLTRCRKLRHLLVVDESENLVGVITQTDIVNAYVKLMEHQAELETENQMLHLLSYEDSLMKIGNRRAMEVELSYAEASTRRYNKTYAVALIDVDFFKKYNDNYGHQAGDDALAAIAHALKSSIRDTDRLYRYGGEEILLLLPELSGKKAFSAAERAKKAVENLQIPHAKSPLGRVTVSIGVASEQGEEWKLLITRADKALYNAKKSGRNKVLEEPPMNYCS